MRRIEDEEGNNGYLSKMFDKLLDKVPYFKFAIDKNRKAHLRLIDSDSETDEIGVEYH